jgi:hypothetical protein
MKKRRIKLNTPSSLNCWLYGWKDIEKYLGCDRKTLMDWEKNCDLPIYRPARGRPMAHPDKLTEWIENQKEKKKS